jgi:heme oxygenase
MEIHQHSNAEFLQTIKDNCPAFKDGCPYAGASEKLSSDVNKCPVFQSECPFKSEDSIKLMENFKTMSHAKISHNHDSTNAHDEHDAHRDLKAKCPAFQEGCPFKQLPPGFIDHMKSCPQFSQGCPFKTVCSDGSLLITALQARRWDMIFSASDYETIVDKEGNEELEEPIHLAAELKQGTKEAHSLAESVSFVPKLKNGEVDRPSYAKFLVGLYYIYSRMEELLDQHKEHQFVAPIHFPNELNRTESLKKDLEFFYGANWNDKISPSPVTKKYLQLLDICATSPELMISHAYTRYLGDLSGGQILRKLARRSMKLDKEDASDPDLGTKFYTFKNISNGKEFKNAYRAKLDSLRMDLATADRVVREANRVFKINMFLMQEVMNELDPTQLEKFDRELLEEYTKKDKTVLNKIHHQVEGKGGQCPFMAQASGKSGAAKPQDELKATYGLLLGCAVVLLISMLLSRFM